LRTKKQVCFLYKLALSLMFHFMSCMCIHLIKNKKCIHLIKNKKESRHASCTQTTTPMVAAALLHAPAMRHQPAPHGTLPTTLQTAPHVPLHVYHALPQPPSHHVTYPEPREPLHVLQHLTNLASMLPPPRPSTIPWHLSATMLHHLG